MTAAPRRSRDSSRKSSEGTLEASERTRKCPPFPLLTATIYPTQSNVFGIQVIHTPGPILRFRRGRDINLHPSSDRGVSLLI